MGGLSGNEALMEIYSKLKTLSELDPDLKGELRVPVLVTTGGQSCGKTTFIQALVGFPVGFTDRDTGTRCPVRYILRRAKEGQGPSWRVGGCEVSSAEQIREKVEEHMKGLGFGFSNEALVVEIVQTEGFDLDITDLPGLKDKTQPDHQHIAEIVRGYLQDSDCLPVVLCRAPQSHEVAHDLDSLYSLGLDPSRSILVVNYFNHVFRDFTRVSDLNKYCSGFQGRCDGVFFAQLHIEDGFRQEGKSFKMLTDYFGKLPQKELGAFAEREAHMDQDQVKKTLHKVRGQFCYIDCVEGGLQDVSHEEYRCVNENAINSDAEQYFHSIKAFIAEELAMKLNAHVYHPLANKLVPDFRTEMAEVVNKIQHDDMEFKAIVGDSAKESIEELERAKDELAKVQEVVDRICPGGPPCLKARTPPRATSQVSLIKGTLSFPRMDFSKMTGQWHKAAEDSAAKDLMRTCQLNRRQVEASLHGNKLSYTLHTNDPSVKGISLEDMNFKETARLYCKVLGRPLNDGFGRPGGTGPGPKQSQRAAAPTAPSLPPARAALLFPGLKPNAPPIHLEQSGMKSFLERSQAVLGEGFFANTPAPSTLDMWMRDEILVFLANCAAFEQFKQENQEEVRVSALAGFSSAGQYAALVAAGVLNFDDALRLLKLRCKAMIDKGKGWTLSVEGLGQDEADELVKSHRGCWVSNYEGPTSCCVGGVDEAIQEMKEDIAVQGGRVTATLPVAVHTPLMKPASQDFGQALKAAQGQMKKPSVAVWLNSSKALHADGDPGPVVALLKGELVNPVRRAGAISAMSEESMAVFYEVPAGEVKFKQLA